MSTFKVEVVTIDEILVHPKADRLELARIKGWNVVVPKNAFKVGDLAIYLPVDSVLNEHIETILFPPDSKIKLNRHRVRSIKIRGVVSQGMLVRGLEVSLNKLVLGDDLTVFLGVSKYEPPEPSFGTPSGGQQKKKTRLNVNFSKYTDIENIKNFPDVFAHGERVYISEKMHGTSSRYGHVLKDYKGFWGPLHHAFDFVFRRSRYEWVYGTRNVQLQSGAAGKSWYAEDVYTKMVDQYKLKTLLKPGEVIYGEIVGDHIQTNYAYGYGPGQHALYVYDVKLNDRWLNWEEFRAFCDSRGLTRVPELYVGPYSKDVELHHRDGDSTVGGQKIREGVVIKPVVEEVATCGRKVLKSISDAYYLEDNSDFH